MFAKIWAIARKDLYTTYTDRTTLLIMLATPLALATIIGFAFGNFFGSGSDVPISNIPVAIVNLDQGVETNGMTLNNGDVFVQALVPSADAPPEMLEDNALFKLTDSVLLTDADAARTAVQAGDYAVAIIIPADFTEKITYSQAHPTLETVEIELITSANSPTSAAIMESVVTSISNQIMTGSITVAATIDSLIEMSAANPQFGIEFGAASLSGAFAPDFSPAYTGAINPLRIEQQTITGEQSTGFNPLVSFGSAQAVFFMMFTAMAVANSMHEEKEQGTLQRIVVSPTERMAILGGKMLSTFLNCWAQIVFLFAALTLIGSIMTGALDFIWGDNLPALFAVIFATAFAASGLGTLVMSLVRTAEMGNTIGGIISMVFGFLGGAFFNLQSIPALASLSRLSLNYWGVDAFTQLATGRADILPNLAFLLTFGAVTFALGIVLFNRRTEF